MSYSTKFFGLGKYYLPPTNENNKNDFLCLDDKQFINFIKKYFGDKRKFEISKKINNEVVKKYFEFDENRHFKEVDCIQEEPAELII